MRPRTVACHTLGTTKRKRQTERQTDRDSDRQADRERARARARESDRYTGLEPYTGEGDKCNGTSDCV